MAQTYLRQTLECTAIAMGVQELLAPGKGEIHNSGNWADALRSTSEKIIDKDGQEKGYGSLDLEQAESDRKAEKRSHFTRFKVASDGQIISKEPLSDLKTKSHTHVYIPFDECPVNLPAMWPWEAQQQLKEAKANNKPVEKFEKIINQWQSIKPLTQNQISNVVDKLGNSKLTKWLEKFCQGKLNEN